uniref:Coatomer subunit zeta n=1 Tax=Calidris pygmaea TaxID=425635 RepID=A0A8C3PIZ2_9CHAR
GDRLFVKYYDDTYPTAKEQKAFEKNIFNKTHRTDSEIALLEGLTVVYKSSIDLYFYVIGSSYENEVGGTLGGDRVGDTWGGRGDTQGVAELGGHSGWWVG